MNVFGRRFLSLSRLPSKKSLEEIKALVEKTTVVVFMKGAPKRPLCEFSKAVVDILDLHGVKYDSHDELSDQSLQGVYELTNWPTPQVYLNGKFLGGCDIIMKMHRSGDLVKELEKVGIKSALTMPEEKATI